MNSNTKNATEHAAQMLKRHPKAVKVTVFAEKEYTFRRGKDDQPILTSISPPQEEPERFGL